MGLNVSLIEILKQFEGRIVSLNTPLEEVYVNKISSLDSNEENSLIVVKDKEISNLSSSFFKESCCYVISDCRELDINVPSGINLISVNLPFKNLIKRLIDMVYVDEVKEGFISKNSDIDQSVIIGSDAIIESFVRINKSCKIGNKSHIMSHVSLGENVTIGENCTIHANVTIYANSIIGNGVIIHANTIIGVDGFGYNQLADGRHEKIRHIGNVIIGDDVEIGGLCSIARGTISSTIIKRGTKLDSHVHIAHNNIIGEDCAFAAFFGAGGSVKIGAGTFAGGQSGVKEHINVAPKTSLSGRGLITRDVKDPGNMYSGSPAMKGNLWLKQHLVIKYIIENFTVLKKIIKERK